MIRAEIGCFLRTRREALRPADVGLATARRRAPGLRQAEVASLAGVPVDSYERLEQGCGDRPSPAVLTALATALRLTTDERGYLYRLAGYPAMAASPTDRWTEPGMRFLLDSLTTAPAHIVDNLTTVVAQNDLSVALFGPWERRTGPRAYAVWQWFAEPELRMRDFLEDDESAGRRLVAELRATTVGRGHATAERLIADLSERSAEFASYWQETEVALDASTARTLQHPRVGTLHVHRDALISAPGGHRLIVMRPQPGTGTAERIAALRPQPAASGAERPHPHGADATSGDTPPASEPPGTRHGHLASGTPFRAPAQQGDDKSGLRQ